MQELVTFQLPRCVKPKHAVGLPQLHCFSDGGVTGYGAVVWLRWHLDNGTNAVTFVIAKSLVAPLKRKSIPRLELMAAIVMSRLAKLLEETIHVCTVCHIW